MQIFKSALSLTLPRMATDGPSIDVRISTSSPVLDLEALEPWSLEVTLILCHKSPITFYQEGAGLFDGRLLDEGGVTFTNLRTRQKALCGEVFVCNFGPFGGPLSRRNKHVFHTLYPGKGHTITKTIALVFWVPKIKKEPGMTSQAHVDKQNSLPEVWRWPNVSSLKDGQTYELGISTEARVTNWMEGSVDEILALQTPLNFLAQGAKNFLKRLDFLQLFLQPQPDVAVTGEVRKDAIEYRVVETTTLTMKRPDKDGSLALW